MLVLIATLAAASPALAQKGIRWNNDAAKVFETARKQKVPVLAYVKGSSGNDEDIEDIERDQRKSFDDPRIVKLAERFLCVQLSPTRHKEALKKWNINERLNLFVVVTDPKGDLLTQVQSGDVAEPDRFGREIAGAWRTFSEEKYKAELEPVLKAADSNPKQLLDALKDVREGVIRSGDQGVIEVLKREGLDARTRLEAFKTLSELSTEPSVKELLNLAAAGDKDALKALQSITPEGATHLLPSIGNTENPALGQTAYAAAAKVCKVPQPKPDKFWENASAADQQKEIDRVKERVEKVAERWKEEYGNFR
jgi:hypothetical protein